MTDKALIAIGMAAAMALPASANAQGGVPYNQTINGTRLELTARGEVNAVPDLAIINAGVVTQAIDARTAMAQNAQRIQAVIGALRGAGIAERDIRTQSVSLQPQYRYQENRPPVVTGYQASNQLNVRFRNINQAGPILDTLVRQGVNQIDGPTLTIDQPDAMLDAARVDAIRKARARAEVYARASGLNVRRIVVISEQADVGGRPVPMMAARAAMVEQASTAIVPGEQEIGVSVSVVFELM
jgi:uncharacterized protein